MAGLKNIFFHNSDGYQKQTKEKPTFKLLAKRKQLAHWSVCLLTAVILKTPKQFVYLEQRWHCKDSYFVFHAPKHRNIAQAIGGRASDCPCCSSNSQQLSHQLSLWRCQWRFSSEVRFRISGTACGSVSAWVSWIKCFNIPERRHLIKQGVARGRKSALNPDLAFMV